MVSHFYFVSSFPHILCCSRVRAVLSFSFFLFLLFKIFWSDLFILFFFLWRENIFQVLKFFFFFKCVVVFLSTSVWSVLVLGSVISSTVANIAIHHCLEFFTLASFIAAFFPLAEWTVVVFFPGAVNSLMTRKLTFCEECSVSARLFSSHPLSICALFVSSEHVTKVTAQHNDGVTGN